MRVYLEEKETELAKVVCNGCRKELLVENGILKEECIHIEHNFGFFGTRDGENDRFDLCEACYEKLKAALLVPAETWDRKEML
ncbi:MAG: hypothetical protein J6A08_02660 [Lachnospiraceae bacterium]|nr:hypothetical protein [Lachnospiraceae bacterium]